MGKYYIVDGAICTCKFGVAPGMLKVDSQQKLILNVGKKTATTNELQNTFYPPGFGTCKFGWPPRPCAPMITQWLNPYQGMRLPSGAFPLMPDSKGVCAVSGTPCVEIVNHGQMEIPGVSHAKNATAEHLCDLDPCADSMYASEEECSEIGVVWGKQESEPYKQTLIEEIRGQKEAYPGEQVRYEVERFNKKITAISNDELNNIGWGVLIDGITREENIGRNFTFRVRPEWAGSEMIISARLNNNESVVECETRVNAHIRSFRLADTQSFNVLLSSLPRGARGMIRMDNDNFLDTSSVEVAYSQFSHSGNMQALRTIVTDGRMVVFNATANSFRFFNTEEGKIDGRVFQTPIKRNDFQDMLRDLERSGATPQHIEQRIQDMKLWGIVDEYEIVGLLGISMRPANAQEPFPGGAVSTTNYFEIFINPLATPTDQARMVGHELFGHLYIFFIGKDPRHSFPRNNPLEDQITARERESEINSKQ